MRRERAEKIQLGNDAEVLHALNLPDSAVFYVILFIIAGGISWRIDPIRNLGLCRRIRTR